MKVPQPSMLAKPSRRRDSRPVGATRDALSRSPVGDAGSGKVAMSLGRGTFGNGRSPRSHTIRGPWPSSLCAGAAAETGSPPLHPNNPRAARTIPRARRFIAAYGATSLPPPGSASAQAEAVG
jgi:hypothetical protein